MMHEILRRVRNLLIGPYPMLDAFARERAPLSPSGKPERHVYLLPHPALLRWYEDPVLHFDRLGIIEIDWLVYTAGLYWKDQN